MTQQDLKLPEMIIFDVDETIAIYHVGWKVIEKYAQEKGLEITEEARTKYEQQAWLKSDDGVLFPRRDIDVARQILQQMMGVGKYDFEAIDVEYKRISDTLTEGYLSLDGALDTVNYFRDQGIAIVFITAGANKRFIEKLGLFKEGDLYYGGETELPYVDKAYCIHKALEEKNISDPKTVWAVGDQRKDIEIANDFGVIPIATTQCQELAQENNLIQYIFKLKQQEPDALAFNIWSARDARRSTRRPTTTLAHTNRCSNFLPRHSSRKFTDRTIRKGNF